MVKQKLWYGTAMGWQFSGFRKYFFSFFSLAFLFFCLSSCQLGHLHDLSTKKTSSIRWLVENKPETFDWTLASDRASLQHASLVMEGLVRLSSDDSGIQVHEALASRWSAESPTCFEFRLRPNVLWSDGTPLRSIHFLQAWKRLLLNAAKNPYASLLFPIRNAKSFAEGKVAFEEVGIEEKDALTLRLTLEAPMPNFPAAFAHPATWPTRFPDFQKENPVTLGPLRLDHQTENEYYYLPNSLYHGGQIALHGLRVRVEPRASTRVDLFLAGEADLVDELPDTYRTELRNHPLLSSERKLSVVTLLFNASRRPFQNIAARQAFIRSLQKDELPRFIDPLAEIAMGLLPLTSPATASENSYSPEEARQLLEPFVYEPGGSRPPSETSLKGISRTSLGYDPQVISPAVASNLQAQWAKNLGIIVDVVPTGKVPLENLPIQLVLVKDDPLSPSQGLSVLSDSTLHGRDRAYDQALLTASTQTDMTHWQEGLRTAEAILVRQDAVAIPLFLPSRPLLKQANIHGLKQNPIELWDFRDTTIDG